MKNVHIALASWSHLHHYPLCCKSTGTGCQCLCVWWRVHTLAGCIMRTDLQRRWRDHGDDIVVDHNARRSGSARINLPAQVAKLCHALPLDKQEEILDLIEFLGSHQPPAW